MRYTPAPVPEGLPPAAAQYLREELQRIALALAGIDNLGLVQKNAEPDKYGDGLVVYADGTNWNPGSGEGLYARYNSAWNALGGGGGGLDGTADEDITGQWDFQNSGGIRIKDSAGTDWAKISHDGTNVLWQFTNTTNFKVETTSPADSFYVGVGTGRVGIKTAILDGDLNIGGSRLLRFQGGSGSLQNVNLISSGTSVTATPSLSFGSNNVRINGDVGAARLCVVGRTVASLPAIGVKEGAAGQVLLSTRDTSNAVGLEITHAGFRNNDNANGIYRFEYFHAMGPSSADGDGAGIALKTENASGVERDVGWIDAVYDDISLDTASMRFMVRPGASDSDPTEAMRIQGDTDVSTHQLEIIGPVLIKEQASANADQAGYGQLWVKNTTPCELWFTDDAGTDTQIV